METEEQNKKSDPKSLLAELISRCGALTGLLVTKEGVSLGEAGNTSYLNATAMAALVAGMFSATKEVARMVGETQFSILLQQGEKRHVHIGLVDDSTMLVIVFEDYQRMGMVRHEARRMCPAIAEALRQDSAAAQAQKPPIATPQFREYALNLVDRIFEGK